MKGVGTDDKLLRRIIYSHRESGILPEANRYIVEQTGKSLVKWVKSETSGDYERLLVAILNANGCL